MRRQPVCVVRFSVVQRVLSEFYRCCVYHGSVLLFVSRFFFFVLLGVSGMLREIRVFEGRSCPVNFSSCLYFVLG